MINRKGKIKRKIALLLLGGLALGLSGSPKKYFEILSEIADKFQGIKKPTIKKSLKSLSKCGFLKETKKVDGTIEITLNEKGRRLAEFYKIDDLKIKRPKKWDGNWIIVIFDIPERRRGIRDAIRTHLKNLGFFEFQKSVFIFPFPCTEEIDFIVRFYKAREHVRIISANSIDNEYDLMKKFGLLAE